MGKSYVKFLELAQLCRSKAYMETDDFGLKVNLLYFDKVKAGLNTCYRNNKGIFSITFLLDLSYNKNAEFSTHMTKRLVQGYTYFITQAGNKLEYIGYNKECGDNGIDYLELNFLNNQSKGVENEQTTSY